MSTTITKTTWTKPLAAVYDRVGLQLAHTLARQTPQGTTKWDTPIPQHPNTAPVKFERLQQAAVFAMPLLMLVLTVPFIVELGLSMAMTVRVLSVTVLMAVVLGWLLHTLVDTAVTNAISRAKASDNGRFDLCNHLMQKNDVHPLCVTPELVTKLSNKHLEMVEKDQAKKAGMPFTASQYHKLRTAADSGSNVESLKIMAASMGLTAVDSVAQSVMHHSMHNFDINPATGLPMVGLLDAMGNPFGTNFNTVNSIGGVDVATGEIHSMPTFLNTMDASTGFDMGSTSSMSSID